MPRVKYVVARKDYPESGIKKGDKHFVWAIKRQRGGVVRRSMKQPRPSQLTESAFFQPLYSTMEAFEDACEDAVSFADFRSACEDVVSALNELADEQEEKFNNMPEGFQQGETGQLLEGRAQSCRDLAESLEAVDIPDDPEKDEDAEEGEDANTDEDALQAVRDEFSALGYEGE